MPNELTVSDAAAQSGKHVRTLRFAIERGYLKARKIGTQWVLTPAALDRWLREGKHRPGPSPTRKRK